MYDWVTHTWNPIKGRCSHNCSYCYMKKWGELKPMRLVESELKCDLGKDNFIFVGSSCDIFAADVPEEWIRKVIERAWEFENTYLFQTKNPENMRRIMPPKTRCCVTIETNRWYPEIMRNSPHPLDRVNQSALIRQPLYITIEPILDFDLYELLGMMNYLFPEQINIGADSLGHKMPEPPKEKILDLISVLEVFTTVKQKSNIKRLLK